MALGTCAGAEGVEPGVSSKGSVHHPVGDLREHAETRAAIVPPLVAGERATVGGSLDSMTGKPTPIRSQASSPGRWVIPNERWKKCASSSQR